MDHLDALLRAISPSVDVELPGGTNLVLSGIVLPSADREEQISEVMALVETMAEELGLILTDAELKKVSTQVDSQLSRVLDQ